MTSLSPPAEARCSVCDKQKTKADFHVSDDHEWDMMIGLTEKRARKYFAWYEPNSMAKTGYNFGPTCGNCVHICMNKNCKGKQGGKGKLGGPIYFKQFKDFKLLNLKTHPFCNECLYKEKIKTGANTTN